MFYILLSLRDGERHGYEILKQIETGSVGKVRLGPATLYTSIRKLLESDLVQEVPRPKDSDSRRRYYRLTSAGRKELSLELDRMEMAISIARPTALRARA